MDVSEVRSDPIHTPVKKIQLLTDGGTGSGVARLKV